MGSGETGHRLISGRERLARIGGIVLALATWFGTQALLGARELPDVPGHGAGELLTRADGLLVLTEPANRFLHGHEGWADALLISSSLGIDILGIFIILRTILGPEVRPFLGLLLLFALRQVSQGFCALPAPEGMIWRDPGVPSLLVTYGVANDFFFSGHTAIAVYAAREVTRLESRAWIPVAWGVAIFEILAVLVLRAHYTMDVFTGVLAALYVSLLVDRFGSAVDRWLERLVRRRGDGPGGDEPR